MAAPAMSIGGDDSRRGRNDGAVIALVSLAHVFSHFYIFALPALAPFINAELHLSYFKLGLLVSAFSLTSGFAQFFTGVLVDRFGAKPVLYAGMTLLATAVGMVGFAHSYWLMLVLVAVAGLGNSVFHPADFTVLSASVRAARMGRAFAIHTFAGYVGFALGPVVAVLLNAQFGWRNTLFICGGAGLVVVLLLWSQRHLMGDAAPGQRTAIAPGRAGIVKLLGLDIVLKSRPIVLMLFFYIFAGMLSIGLNGQLALALHKLQGFTMEQTAWATSILVTGGAIGTLVGGDLAMRFKRLDTVALFGYGAASILLLLIAVAAMPLAALYAVFALAGFMLGVINPSRDMMVRAIAPAGHSGKVFGFVASGFDIGGLIAAPAFALMVDLQAPAWVFYTAAVIMALAFATAYAAGKARKPVPAPAAAAAE